MLIENRKNARIAGILYFLQIPLGVFGIIYMPKILLVDGNIKMTILNILSNEFIFRLSIYCSILCSIITFITSIYISKLLKFVNENLAKLIVIFTMIMIPITLLNELNYIGILFILKSKDIISAFHVFQIESIIILLLKLHEFGLHIVGIFFGLWLLPIGYLIIRSNFIPKFIGCLLLLTCFGYLIDFTTSLLFPNIGFLISEYTWLGEVLMVLWLIMYGFKKNKI